MEGRLEVICRLNNLDAAYRYRDTLAQVGIPATLASRATLDGPGGEAGTEESMPVELSVPEEYAERAREIVVELQQWLDDESDPAADDGALAEQLEGAWPRCPDCGERRTTKCPICQTAGTSFAPADATESLGEPADAEPDRNGPSCGCGAGDCDARQDEAPCPPLLPPSPSLLICPTCDEPFSPEYLERCEWCGHVFEQGVPVAEEEPEEINAVTIAFVLGLTLLLFGLGSWFLYIL